MASSQSRLTLLVLCAGSLLAQVIILGLFLQTVLEHEPLANAFISDGLRESVVTGLGGRTRMLPAGPQVNVWTPGIIAAALALAALVTTLSAALRNGSGPFLSKFARASQRNAAWTAPLGAWVLVWLASGAMDLPQLSLAALLIVGLAPAVTLAGWLYTATESLWNRLASPGLSRWSWGIVAGGILVYSVVFVAMNWGLWWNLRIPHGDSAMYEEHLWNVTHGKGFRSYLDQGLFLGEHLQVIHLLLVPLYLVWPSQMLLELVESVVLAAGAIPVFLLARRFTGNPAAAAMAALAWLLYFPMQYLDIAIDLKTFRPTALAVPALLAGILAMEKRRWGQMTIWFLLALSSQEDFAIAIGSLGLWMAATSFQSGGPEDDAPALRGQRWVGLITALAAAAYLFLALKFIIPYFRSGETVHYARYFEAFGRTPGEIARNMLLHPGLLAQKFFRPESLAWGLLLLVPLGFPWRAWGRLLVGLPLFVLLCLNELAQNPPGPYHHFHAPLLPILVWAACAALGNKDRTDPASITLAGRRAGWLLCCALATTVFYSLSPLGIAFWDSGQRTYWRRLYLPDERARQFEKVLPLLPPSSRVASTDFVHPRLTHFERSYDYSHYPRRVADYEDKVPDDTDFIVIDTRHPYSEIHTPEEVRELQREPDKWEIVPVNTQGYFIVLKRVHQPR